MRIQDKNLPNWGNSEVLSKEFESVGFYLSNHPLEDFKDALIQYKTKSYKDFENSDDSESFIAGTIMLIKEKKRSIFAKIRKMLMKKNSKLS